MGNCLVTKLKESVNNDNLNKLGVLTLLIHTEDVTNNLQRRLDISTGSNGVCKMKVVGTGGIGTSPNNTSATELDIPANTSSAVIQYYFANGDYVVEIDNMYNITSIYINGAVGNAIITPIVKGRFLNSLSNLSLIYVKDFNTDLEQLKSLNLTILILSTLTGNKVTGDVKSVGEMTSLEYIDWQYEAGIYGNIADLGELTSLTTMHISTSGMYGRVEDFVNAQCNATTPRVATSEPIFSKNLLNKITFGSINIIDATYNEWLEWNTSDKIVVYLAPTNVSSYTNATKVYAKGATAQEISDWKTAGKTVWAYENEEWVQK